MKKILSFALALLFSWSMFAQQDAVWFNFETAQTQQGWQFGNPDEIFEEPWNNWSFQRWSFGTCLESDGYAGEIVNHAAFMPVFALTSDYATGWLEFWVGSTTAEQTENVGTNYWSISYTTDGETYYDFGGNEYGNRSQATGEQEIVRIPFSELQGITLSSTPTNILFVFTHIGCTDEHSILLIDDVIVRKRSDAFIIDFDLADYYANVQGSMDYMVTSAGGNLTAPECGFTVPGKHFVCWIAVEGEQQFEIYAGDDVEGIEGDMTWYAYFEDDENGGGDPQTDVWTVTFNNNGGQGTMAPMTFDKNSSDNWLNPSSVTCTFTRTGYHFVGWSTSPTGAVEYAEINVNRDMTFYAIWEQDSDPLAINDINAANISIYPNPAQGMVRVNGVTINSLDLLDLTGRVVLSSETNTIDLSSLINGVYMLRINANEGTAVRKIVKR